MDPTPLISIPLFRALKPEQAAALGAMLRPRTLGSNEPLFWFGDSGEEFYVIERGRIQLTLPDASGREIALAMLKPGDFFGEIALLDGGPRTATARAVTETTLLALTREQFQQFITNNPSAALQIITELGQRQRTSVDKIRGIRNVNEVFDESTTPWQRIVAGIANIAASKAFLLFHLSAFSAWVAANVALGRRGPDPFPFPFLGFWSSCEAIFLSLFILVAQTVQSRNDRIRAEIEYQVALKMQFEIMQLHQKMDRMPGELMEKIGATPSRPGSANGEGIAADKAFG
jgi:CRP-like cAMP-binding protein